MVAAVYGVYTDFQTIENVICGVGNVPSSSTVNAWFTKMSRIIDAYYVSSSAVTNNYDATTDPIVKEACLEMVCRYYSHYKNKCNTKIRTLPHTYLSYEVRLLLDAFKGFTRTEPDPERIF